MTSPLFQLAAAVARSAAATVPPALVVPEAEKEPQKSSWPEKEGSLELACDRSQAAAAIVRAVRRWRFALIDRPTGVNPDLARDAVWEAGEEYDALWKADDDAASAIVRAVRRWREALAGMSNTDPDAALDAVWEAGETLDALREQD